MATIITFRLSSAWNFPESTNHEEEDSFLSLKQESSLSNCDVINTLNSISISIAQEYKRTITLRNRAC